MRNNINAAFMQAPLWKELKRLKDARLPQSKIRDRSLPGFGPLLSITGTMKFIVRGRDVNGKQQQVTIGPLDDWTLTDARSRAALMLDALAEGDDLMPTEGTIKLQCALEQYVITRN